MANAISPFAIQHSAFADSALPYFPCSAFHMLTVSTKWR